MNQLSEKLPVTVVTGFLGSGKTTLINKILSEDHGRKIAVIVNEFGEVSIDGQLIQKSDEEDLIEFNNGCLCCTVRGDLIETIDKLKKQSELDAILIETTGLADPAPVASSFFLADELSSDKKITINIRGFGTARAKNGFMPEAPVPAAERALKLAGLTLEDIDAVKTHNPFAVNDIYFVKQTGYDRKKMNNYGCSLIYGHPNGPVGVRGVIELIEELEIRGGGFGLFTGCAAGDTGMAVVIEVSDK